VLAQSGDKPILKQDVHGPNGDFSGCLMSSVESEEDSLAGALEVNNQYPHWLALPQKMRHKLAVFKIPENFFARPSLQLHEIKALRNVNVTVDESIRRVGLVELHQF
jgi:hypothetical protein